MTTYNVLEHMDSVATQWANTANHGQAQIGERTIEDEIFTFIIANGEQLSKKEIIQMLIDFVGKRRFT
ncbi:MAG: hypothetical protein Q8L37_07210 [Candidatus Gottesmanbacteria bacterium]|nr:hypothetical protein [Candidatus Gottesmanbacteria bacterium]